MGCAHMEGLFGPMDKILKKTRVWCCACEGEHEASVFEYGDSVLCKVACPKQEKTVTLSNDSATWKAVCEKSYFDASLMTGLPGGFYVPGYLPPEHLPSAPPMPTPKPDGQNRNGDRRGIDNRGGDNEGSDRRCRDHKGGDNQCSNKGIRHYRLEITNACNFRCPVCYANANAGGGAEEYFIDLKTIEKIASALQREGVKGISLTGGEPTVHPQLEKIISIFTQAGIHTTILTNGIRIAQEPGYITRLRKHGLRRAYIQFDTLNPDVHQKIRGNTLIEEKKKALRNCKEAKIKTSVIAVIIRDNLDETWALLDYMKSLVPWFGEIIFVTAIREAGRFDLCWDSFVYKEEIIKSLIKNSPVNGINIDNFHPLPVYRPFGLNINPHSNVVLPVVFIGKKIELLEKYLNIKKFSYLLNGADVGEGGVKNTAAAKFKALWYFLVSLDYRKTPALLWILFCYLSKAGSTYINYVLIENFLSKEYQDMECLDNCNAYYLGPNGEVSSACVYNQDFKSGRPWTKYESPVPPLCKINDEVNRHA